MKVSFSDSEIITAIKNDGAVSEKVIQYIYYASGIKEDVEKYIMSRSGTKELSEDVFQEGVVHLMLNIKKGLYKGDGTVKGYLFGICRNIWLKKISKDKKERENAKNVNIEEVDYHTPEYFVFDTEKKQTIDHVLSKLGEMCKKVLILWKTNYSMKEIAGKLGYKSEGVVRKKKHQCMKKLIEFVKDNPEIKQLLKD